MSDTPLVSAVIPTFQHGDVVAEAVASALAQSYSNLEIIVVDDGSTDNTKEVLQGFGARIRVIHQPNRGLSAARNSGISASRGDLIAFLDADDTWMPTKLERQVPLFSDASVGLVGADMIFFDETGEYPDTSLSRFNPPKGRVYPGFFTGHAILLMPTVVTRRACFDGIGQFDESLTSLEDADMWHRISRRWALDFVNEPLARYRLSPGQMSKNYDRMLANYIRMREKCVAADPGLLTTCRAFLDSCFYCYYLELARQHMKRDDGASARDTLREYRRRRGITVRYLAHWLATWAPVAPAHALWRLYWRRFRSTGESG